MVTKAGVLVLESQGVDYEEWLREWALGQPTDLLSRFQRSVEIELTQREEAG